MRVAEWVIIVFLFVCVLLEEPSIEVYHFINVGLELWLIPSVFDVHLFDLTQLVKLYFRILNPIFHCHASQTGVGFVKDCVVAHVELVDESGRTD